MGGWRAWPLCIARDQPNQLHPLALRAATGKLPAEWGPKLA